MFTIQGKTMRYALDEKGRNASCYNRLTCHEYVERPGAIWKMIYLLKNTERVEVPIWADKQTPDITVKENEITLRYDGLRGEDGLVINALLQISLKMNDLGLQATAGITNRDSRVQLMELQLTPVSGVRSLSGDPENDYIAWPSSLGRKVRNPAFRDLSTFAGFRKYERHDQFHTDMDALYQGSATMQWYDWYRDGEGLYVASEDTTRQAVCLHIERETKENILRVGIIRYPMLEQGESWEGEAIDCYPHLGDWHAGAKMYRKWMEEKGGFIAPVRPAWCQEFTGWLRVILKQHHCELNWDFSDIPALYDEAEKAGFNTLYLLGWEKGGFARMWPDYVVDDRMGGAEKLREGINYVHSKGGRVMLFLSYALIDHQSDFYRKEGGDKATIKSIWGEDIPFAETYCGEGTYRKTGNPPMPMYLACPGSPLWQEKMKWSAKQCFDLGADGVLYDIGGMTPFFCYAEGHTHKKPSHSHENKAANYAGLRKYVKTFGDDKIIMMEHNVDIFGQSMDMAHSGHTGPDARLLSPETAGNPEDAKNDLQLNEMYRYTFPELLMTNRECGEDENHYLAHAGQSFLYGLKFDMTIFRCCGKLSDIPRYLTYLQELTALCRKYADYLLRGRFIDNDGFTADNAKVFVKGWKGADGKLALTLWNPTGNDETVHVTGDDGSTVTVTVKAEKATAVMLG